MPPVLLIFLLHVSLLLSKEGEREREERQRQEVKERVKQREDIADNMWENPFKSMECFIKAVML